jgi:hypothetical protein
MNVKRTIEEDRIWREHSLKYQRDCISAFYNQPVNELFKNLKLSMWEFAVMMKAIDAHNFTDYYLAETYLNENNIDFPGKKEYFHFLLTEKLSGEGKY